MKGERREKSWGRSSKLSSGYIFDRKLKSSGIQVRTTREGLGGEEILTGLLGKKERSRKSCGLFSKTKRTNICAFSKKHQEPHIKRIHCNIMFFFFLVNDGCPL